MAARDPSVDPYRYLSQARNPREREPVDPLAPKPLNFLHFN
jgi:hypothetical protein